MYFPEQSAFYIALYLSVSHELAYDLLWICLGHAAFLFFEHANVNYKANKMIVEYQR